MHMIALSPKFFQNHIKIITYRTHNTFALRQQFISEHLLSILGNEHQMNMNIKNSMASFSDSRFNHAHQYRLTDIHIMKTRTVRYRYRAHPTREQEAWLTGLFGATRVIYNSYIWERDEAYRNKTGETEGQTISKLTKYSTLPKDKQWLRDYPAWTIQAAAITAKKAYQEFFKGIAGSRKNRISKPRYKKKKNSSGSAQWSSGGIRSLNKLNRKYSSIELQKYGRESFNLKYRDTRELPSKPSSVTLLKDKLGRYWISFVVKQPIAIPKNSGSALGVDLGLTDLVAVVSTNGERYKVSAPKYYRQAEYKLKRLQQKHGRKNKGSKNEEKARLKLAKQHSKVTNRRKDAYQKLAFKMASESQAICLEKLNTIGMLKNRKLAKSISDASWGTLNQSIKNQAEKQGVQILRCSQFTATSQICSYCWLGSGKKPLAVREWTCECGAVLDRDFNAGVNILLAARHADTINDCGPDIRLELARAVGSETVTSSLADFLKTS